MHGTYVTALVGRVAPVQLAVVRGRFPSQLLVQAASLVPRPPQLLAQHGELALGLGDPGLEIEILLALRGRGARERVAGACARRP